VLCSRNCAHGVFSQARNLIDCLRRGRVAEEAHLNAAVLLPVLAGAAIALQTVLNSLGMRFLGLGGLIGFSGQVTSLLGFAAAALFLGRPEVTGRAIVYAVGSGSEAESATSWWTRKDC
jgi:hypothetical protein